MRPLYEIESDINQILEQAIDPDTGEIVDEGKLDELKTLDVEKNDKIEAVGLFYKNTLAEAEMIAKEKKNLEARQRVAERKAEGLKIYLAKALNGEKFKTPKISISFRKSEKTEITDATKIPEAFLRYPEPEPNKVEIKKALQAGIEVPGAKIIENISTIIK